MDKRTSVILRRIIFIVMVIFLIAVFVEFHNITWGTGNWLGEFSIKWGLGFAAFTIFLISLLGILWLSLWRHEALHSSTERIISFRQRLIYSRWIIALFLLILPVYFFQYTLWGLVFTGIYFRLFIWAILILLLAILFTGKEKSLITWQALQVGVLLSGTSFVIASVFSNVTNYPFNLYWSDGNRLWDYSIMFGRRLYNYPQDQPLSAFISPGRQFLWGLPFLLPKTTILFNRFWSALVLSLPYVVLGWVAFKTEGTRKKDWLLVGLWAFLFLNQGPIYSPLVLSAILVAIAWRRPLWLAIPLVALAGYYAEITRFTWEFAPSLWALMLEMSGIPLKGARFTIRNWGRSIVLAISGISIWYLWPLVQRIWGNRASETSNALSELTDTLAGTVASAQGSVSSQPLLWYRLLPNETYPEGILGGLFIAILPLTILLIYLLQKTHWQISLWQRLAILGPLLAFLIVGLIISTKIGGGNNLHNLDMFLIALFFVAVIAWKNGGSEWFAQSAQHPLWIKVTLILLVALPALPSLSGVRPNLSLTTAEIEQVKILADTEIVEGLPPIDEINDAIWYIRYAIDNAEEGGEILFIDQRQLLTFGYVPKVPLVSEYEKKRMMNEAMSGSQAYFNPYYQDLADQRFSLIITEPLKVYIKDEESVFGEESDAWTKWVAAPTLCYYEPLETLRSVYIQLLVPRQEPLDCLPNLP